MAKRTLFLIFSLIFSLSIQSAFAVRFDESMNELKESMRNAGEYVKNKAKHFMHPPVNAPAHAPSENDEHVPANAPRTARLLLQYNVDDMYKSGNNHMSKDGHKVVLHTSKNPTYNDLTGDPKTTLKTWAYAPNPAAAPLKHKASQMYHSAAGAVKDTGKKLHNTIHVAMSDVMHKSSKHSFHDVTGGDAKTTFKNWANAPTPAAAPTVHSVSDAAKKKIHSTIHMAMKGANEFLPKSSKTHFSDVTGHSGYAPSHAPSPSSVSSAASKRIHKTIHTAMNGNSHVAKPTTFSDATGKTPASLHGWANAPSPLSGHVAGKSVSNAAIHKIHNTIHASVKDKAKHHFNDITGRDPAVINDLAHAPTPSSFAAGPVKNAGKKIHNTIHAAMNEKAREILPNKGKHSYNDMTGVGPVVINDLAHSPAPAPARHAVGSAKTFGKRIHNTIHASMTDKAKKTAKHQYSDKTGVDQIGTDGVTHAPAPARHAAGPTKNVGKKIHNTIHAAKNDKTTKHQYSDKTGVNPVGIDGAPAPAPARPVPGAEKDAKKKLHKTVHYMFENNKLGGNSPNPDTTGSNPFYDNWAKNWLGAAAVQGHQQHFPSYFPHTTPLFHNPWMGAGAGAHDGINGLAGTPRA
ncbi:hypothetical protein ACHQM5_015508 [Ranunculus cassubicifolius]